MDANKLLCAKCNLGVTEKESLAVCDCCSDVYHEKCSDLAASEIRAIIIKKRNLIYFCPSCKDNFKKVPKVIEKLNEAIKINEDLQEENKKLREILTDKENMDNKTDINVIIQEIYERQNRASNVIICNIQESSERNQLERAKEDTVNVKNILGKLTEEVTIKKTFRLGKFNSNKIRPIKVVLGNSEEALTILRNKNRIMVPGVIIFGDQTKIQKEYYQSVKNKLNELIANGEVNKKIRYVNNIPVIVDSISPVQKNK